MTNESKLKKILINGLILVGVISIFYYLSQTFSADEQLFITDTICITPKTQPIQFILLAIGTLVLLFGAVLLSFRIAFFMLAKGIAFPIVGSFLIIASLTLGYFSMLKRQNVESTSDLVIMSILVILVGGTGGLMFFVAIFKRKDK